jgi:hypothetical protein
MMKEFEERKANVEEWWCADEKKKKDLCNKLSKNNVHKAILFSTPYIKNEITTLELFSVAFVRGVLRWQKPPFSICTDIVKYVLAQATDWCAGRLVRVWWPCLRLHLVDTLEGRSKFWIGLKKREGHSITFCSVHYLTLPCRSLSPYNWTEYPDLSTCPIRPLLSRV